MRARNRMVPVLALLLSGACEAAPPTVEPSLLEVDLDDHEITLSLSPNEVAEGPVASRPMELEWEFRSIELESVGSIADIRLHGDHGLVITDWISPQILFLDGPDSLPKRIVGPGEGPGETGRLYAVLSAGSHVVGWGPASPGLSRSFVRTARLVQLFRSRCRATGCSPSFAILPWLGNLLR